MSDFPDDIFDLHADFCKMFTNPNRLRIMWLLYDGERSVTDLADDLGMTVSNVSQHLKVLRDKGAVVSRRDGQTIFYKVTSQKLMLGCRTIREAIVEISRQRGRILEDSSSADLSSSLIT